MIRIIQTDGSVKEYNNNSKESILDGIKIDVDGEDNLVQIYMPIEFTQCYLNIKGDNNSVTIKASKNRISRLNINLGFKANRRKIIIGKNFFCGGVNIIAADNDNTIDIGDDCMFSDQIYIHAEDGHTIYDINTNEVINKSKTGIKIGNHVWVARNTFIGKNVWIAANTIVATHSVVTKSLEQEFASYGGVPAKLLKKGINWDRARISNFSAENIKRQKKIVAVIPARYQSSRFPGKPLACIKGKPMIQWVYERVASMSSIDNVCVATDDERIFNAVKEFGGEAVMTGECSCGTERVYEAVKDIECDVVLNIQGDEPLIKKEMIDLLISAFNEDDIQMATLKKKLTNVEEIKDPNIAKVVTDKNNFAIIFSRSTVPYNRDNKQVDYFKHIGIYGYKKTFLKQFVEMPKSVLEQAEQLEQMRVIENGFKIKVLETNFESIGVDLPEHINKVEKQMEIEKL